MRKPRVIPCLLLKGSGLVKTIAFKNPQYVGDPINAIKIFNDKEVDELILLDISATRENREPPFDMIESVASECFMPVTYGGGITTVEQAQRIISLGVEKIVLNSATLKGVDLVTSLSQHLGSSSTVVAIDVKKDWLGRYRVHDTARQKLTDLDPVSHAQKMVDAGAGEIFVNDVERDGTGKGFDLELIQKITAAVNVPVIVCGGAGSMADFRQATDAGASAVAAGSMFVYMGKHRAVMINYPPYKALVELFK